MSTQSFHSRRVIPVWITFLAAAFVVGVAPARCDPIPAESGWTVRKFMDGLWHNEAGLAGDDVSGDVFVGDYIAETLASAVYRVTRDGTRTLIFSSNQVASTEIAFDPTARLLYVGGGSSFSVLSESGVELEHESHSVPLGGMALGPDGTLYLLDPDHNGIVRYDRTNHTFPTVTTYYELTESVFNLQVDASGNFYVVVDGAGVARITPSGEITFGLAPSPLTRSGFVFSGPDLIYPQWDVVYRLSGGLGPATVFSEGQDPPVTRVCAVQDRIYVRDSVAPFENNVWEYTPTGPTPVKKTTWGLVKSLYR
jgi:hypothetical protein